MEKQLTLALALLTAATSGFAQNGHRIQAANGTLTGATSGGGHKGYGIMYKYTPGNGKDTVPVDAIEAPGGTIFGSPNGNTLIQAKNGLLYGMTPAGGIFGFGGLYSFNPSNSAQALVVSFNWLNGDEPQGSLIQAKSGLIYGMTLFGGIYGVGVLFSYNPVTGKDSVCVNFNYLNGATPYGNLVQAHNGKLYGMTVGGGSNSKGVIFWYDPATGKDSVVVNLNGALGRSPFGSLIVGKDSMLYGMTTNGGAQDSGALFRFNTKTNKDTVLFSFVKASGTLPYGSLMQATNGMLYGMTSLGGANNNGTAFFYDPVLYKDSVIINFNGTNGKTPAGDNKFIQASNGMLYAMTYTGGTYNMGLIFRYNPANGQDTVLVNFNDGILGVPGVFPYDGLVQDTANGVLYGVTQWGGTYVNGGTLFSYNIPAKAFTSITTLGGSSSNTGYVMEASNGMVYGMTSYGGTLSMGTLYRYDPNSLSPPVIEYQFDYTHGGNPYGKLMQASDGFIYGMTSTGDTNGAGNGTIFRFDPVANTESVVLNFSVDPGGGSEPHGGLIQATDGLLYGMTQKDPSGAPGILFSFDPAHPHKNNVLLKFNDTNGSTPFSNLIQAKNKLLYGMTLLGGSNNMGVMFSYNTVTNKDSVLINFNYLNGAYPFGWLTQSSKNGQLYGMTSLGGTHGNGVIFRFNPGTKTDTVVLNFNGTNGSFPISSLVPDSAGLLYGTTRYGGTYNNGVLFSFDPITNAQTVLLNFNADSGAFPNNIIFLHPAVLGVPNVKEQKELIVVYPNPFTNIATVLFSEEGKHYIELDDMKGDKVRYLSTTSKQCNISRESLAAGVYLVKFYDAEQHYVSSSKIVVQ